MTRAWRLARRAFGRDWPLLVLDGGLIAVNSARPGLAAYLTARFVDALVAGRGVLPWVGAWVALQAMEELTNVFGNGLVQGRLAGRAGLRVRELVLRRAAAVPLIRLQDPDFHDRLARASADLGGRLERWMRTGMWMVNAALSTVGAIVALLSLGVGPWLPAALVAAAAVGIWVSGRLATVELRQSQQGARPGRLAGAWAGLLASRPAAPEVRLFGVAAWARARWARAYRDGARVDLAAAGARLRWGGVEGAAGLGAQVVVLALAAAAAVAAGPERGAGVFAGVLTGAVMVQGYFGMAVGALGGLGRHARVIDDLAGVLFEGDALERAREGVAGGRRGAGAGGSRLGGHLSLSGGGGRRAARRDDARRPGRGRGPGGAQSHGQVNAGRVFGRRSAGSYRAVGVSREGCQDGFWGRLCLTAHRRGRPCRPDPVVGAGGDDRRAKWLDRQDGNPYSVRRGGRMWVVRRWSPSGSPGGRD